MSMAEKSFHYKKILLIQEVLKMKKRLLAALLATGMIVSSLTGCGQQTSVKTGSETNVEESKDKENSVPTEEPQEIVTVKWIARTDPQEDDEQVIEAINKILREKYYLELDLVPIARSEYADKINLSITSGEEYDICYTADFVNNFYSNVDREAFIGLSDLLETEAAELLMSVYPKDMLNITTVNGEIYGIPNYQLIYDHPGAYIQKDLAEKYNLDVESINDLDDLVPFMEQIRDNEKDIWPLARTSVVMAPRKFVADVFAQECVGILAGTTEAINLIAHESWYEKMYTLNSFYKQGFFRSDIATVTDESADMAANRYAICIGTCKPGGDVEFSNKYGKEYIMVPFGEPFRKYNAGATTINGISVTSKNPEAALKLLGVMWTDEEVYNTLLYGIEGEHYTKVSDNRIELIPDSGYNRSSYGWMFGNQFNAWLLPGQADDVWEVTEANNTSAEMSMITGFVPDTTNISAEIAQMKSVAQEYYDQCLYVEDFDKWYKDYNDKLVKAGLETCVDEIQKQIDAWKAANGK